MMSEQVEAHKHVVFQYNDDEKNRDVEIDILGDLPDYQVGEIVVRKAKSWKVTQVILEHSTVSSGRVPVHLVFVSDKL
jgi:hypothetical protein